MSKLVTRAQDTAPPIPVALSTDQATLIPPSELAEVGLGPTKTSKKTKKIVDSRPPVGLVASAEAGARRGLSPKIGAPIRTVSSIGAELSGGPLSRMLPPPVQAALLEALGHRGALGSHGPLGKFGPLGRHLHNPAFWMNAFGAWGEWSKLLTDLGGPGNGATGVLGQWGPASKRSLQQLLPLLGPLAGELGPGGKLAVLGPTGPLGALGGLGYLGATGGHGFVLDQGGNFIDEKGHQHRTTDVTYQGRATRYPLFELYPEDRAATMKHNDASWMVRGELDKKDTDGDNFNFTVPAGKPITLTAVPENTGERYAIELFDAKGNSIARSDSESLVNWIHVRFDEPTQLKVRITRMDDGASLDPLKAGIDALLFPMVATGQAFAPWMEAAGLPVDRLGPDRYRLYSVSA